MHDLFTEEGLAALLQVIVIDLTLAGDNAVVIGLAAAGLPREQRNSAILVGILAATVLRMLFASVTVQLLEIIGLLFAGGVLLLWVCWKMWRELSQSQRDEENAAKALTDVSPNADGATSAHRKTFAQAAWQIVIADVSMSLDNVLAVARRRSRAPRRLDLWPRPVDRPHGLSGQFHRSFAATLALDRLCRSCHYFVCRLRNDLPWRARGVANVTPTKSLKIRRQMCC